VYVLPYIALATECSDLYPTNPNIMDEIILNTVEMKLIKLLKVTIPKKGGDCSTFYLAKQRERSSFFSLQSLPYQYSD
jgi:hypothetical protein